MAHRTEITPEMLDGLRSALGADIVSTDARLIRELSHDMWIPTLKADVFADDPMFLAQVVVSPTTTEQVSKTLVWAGEHNVPVVPRGLGSGVVGSGLPNVGGIILDLARLDEVGQVDTVNRTVTVGAGKNMGDLDEELKKIGLSVGHYPQSLYLTSVGGALAMRGSGTFSSLYGDIEDRVADIEVVLPTGEVIQTKSTPRGSLGPDLKQLWIGSEGMYGVITKVTLKLVPVPADRRFASVRFDTFQQALDTARETLVAGVRPAVVRIYDPVEASAGHARFAETPGWLMILAFDGDPRLTKTQEEIVLSIAESHGGESLGEQPGIHWEKRRFNWSWATEADEQEGGIADSIEVTASWDTLDQLFKNVKAAIAPVMPEFMAHVSHIYDQGAGIYMIFRGLFGDEKVAADKYAQAWEIVVAEALKLGAIIGHHHGVGMARAPWIDEALGAEYIKLLRRLQRDLDPHNIMNPDKWASTVDAK